MTNVKPPPYYPQSNGKIERWHKTLKGECIRVQVPLALDDSRRLVTDYVTHYNDIRLHSAIGYLTPNDKLEGCAAAIFAARDRKLAEAREHRKQSRQPRSNPHQSSDIPMSPPRPAIDFAAVRTAITLAAVLQLLGSPVRARGPCPLHGSTAGTSRCFSSPL